VHVPRFTRARRTRSSPRLLALVLLGSSLPTLTFLGHWGLLTDPEPTAVVSAVPGTTLSDGATAAAERAEHARHYHTDLASRASQPLPAGIGLLPTREVLFLTPQRWLQAQAPSALGSGWTVTPATPPPRPSTHDCAAI
jgi:hypothetical protein